MTNERFTAELDAWLRDSEIAPPDVRLSTARAAAGVAVTPQLGRWWPPMWLVPRVRLAPRSGSPASLPTIRSTMGVPSMFTAARIVAVAVVFAIVGGSLLVGRALLPEPVQPLPAVTLSSPSPGPSLVPAPEWEVEPVIGESAAASTFAATKVLYELEDGADPFSLAEGHAKTLLYVDRATGTAYEVERDGYRRTLVAPGKESFDGEIFEAASSVARGGWFTDIIEPDGAYWQWHELYEQAPHPFYLSSGGADGVRFSTVAPAIPAASVTHDKWTYDVYVVDAASGDIIEYRHVGEADIRDGGRISRAGLADALAVYADPVIYVLTDDGVERYVDFVLDEAFELQRPERVATDYRAMHGIGSDGKGELWLFDAVSNQFHVYDKRNGRFLGSWATPPDTPSTAGTTGLVLAGDGTGHVGTIAWITPEGLMVSAPTKPGLVENASQSAVNGGSFRPSDRGDGKRALDWTVGDVRLQADRVRLRTNGRVFRTAGEVVVDTDRYGHDVDLELEWFEHGVHQRLYVQLTSEDSHWWISEIWASDGTRDAKWLYFEDLAPLTRTPTGLSLEGDLWLPNTNADRPRLQEDGSAELVIDGLRLTAFRPQDQPAPLTGCDYLDRDGRRITDGTGGTEPDVPQPADLKSLSPREAESLLQDAGVCYRFSYAWRRPAFEDERLNQPLNSWFHELRCSAPEHGRIGQVHIVADDASEPYQHIIRVDVQDEKLRDLPTPPPYGTDCEPLVPG